MRQIEIPRAIRIGDCVLRDVPSFLRENGLNYSKVYACSGSSASRAYAQEVETALSSLGERCEVVSGLSGTVSEADALAKRLRKNNGDLVIGVGGGRAIDTAKYAANLAGLPFVSIPTSLSHDGITSPIASLLGQNQRHSLGTRVPAGLIIDTKVVMNAPQRMLLSGVADLVSNLTAVRDWAMADRLGRYPYDAYSAMIAEIAAYRALNLETLENTGEVASLAKGLVLSGLAMATAGSSHPCSGGEHLVSHALDIVLGKRAVLHGEQVALGTLICASIHDSRLFEQILGCFQRLGVPTHPEMVGVTMTEVVDALMLAPSTRPERYTVLTNKIRSRRDAVLLATTVFQDQVPK